MADEEKLRLQDVTVEGLKKMARNFQIDVLKCNKD